MNYSTLNELITHLTYGTQLHIGVVFLGKYRNEKLILSHENEIHSSKVCAFFKNDYKNFQKCYRCRNYAIRKAIKGKKPFGAFCINGVYEYTYPILENGEAVAIIFIGNIFKEESEKIRRLVEESYLSSMQQDYGEERCRRLAILIESYMKMVDALYRDQEKTVNPLMENVKEYLLKNLEFEITLQDLANIFHYNPKYLGRLFKKEMGIPLHEYVSEKRLERAKELIENSSFSITQIAMKVGFSNITYFNRVFKNKYGRSPRSFRK